MNLTPAMRQYYELKSQYQDAILFFRMGDFYEMFDEDAKIAHKVLGISLTTRNKNAEAPTPLAGIPYHAKDKYIPLLIEAGYKIAIAEQISQSGSKGIIQREISRIITPATAQLEENITLDMQSFYLASIISEGDIFSLSLIDITSQKWSVYEFINLEELLSFLYQFFPKEIVLESNMYEREKVEQIISERFSVQISYTHTPKNPRQYLENILETQNLIPFGIEKKQACISACALAYSYLQENQKSDFSLLKSISYNTHIDRMLLDENTIKSLDLVYNIATGSQIKGTLFGVLQNTKTPMGKRLLKSEILSPLTNIDEIEKRKKIIRILSEDIMLLDEIRDHLKNIGDIELFMTRLSLGRVSPGDLLQFKYSLIAIKNVIEIIQKSGHDELIKLFS